MVFQKKITKRYCPDRNTVVQFVAESLRSLNQGSASITTTIRAKSGGYFVETATGLSSLVTDKDWVETFFSKQPPTI